MFYSRSKPAKPHSLNHAWLSAMAFPLCHGIPFVSFLVVFLDMIHTVVVVFTPYLLYCFLCCCNFCTEYSYFCSSTKTNNQTWQRKKKKKLDNDDYLLVILSLGTMQWAEVDTANSNIRKPPTSPANPSPSFNPPINQNEKGKNPTAPKREKIKRDWKKGKGEKRKAKT